MINFPPTVRIFLATQPADLRKGFDGLAALTSAVIGLDPLSGHLFVFRNRRGDRLKILILGPRRLRPLVQEARVRLPPSSRLYRNRRTPP